MGPQRVGLADPVNSNHAAEVAGSPSLNTGQGILEYGRLRGLHPERTPVFEAAVQRLRAELAGTDDGAGRD